MIIVVDKLYIRKTESLSDGSNIFVNVVQLGQLRIVLKDTVIILNPFGSYPYFKMYSYKTTATVPSVALFLTSSTSQKVDAFLNKKCITAAQMNPSNVLEFSG